MNKNFLFTTIIGLGVVLFSCGGIPPTYYYRVDYTLPGEGSNHSVAPLTIGVTEFDAASLYEGDRIVYRNSPYEVNFYHYRRWVAPPNRLVTEHVFTHLKKTGAFAHVVRFPADLAMDFVLGGKVRAFEEWDNGSEWYGLVTVEFSLRSVQTNEIVWEDAFSQKTRVPGKKPVQVVQAISESLGAVTEQAITALRAYLAKQHE